MIAAASGVAAAALSVSPSSIRLTRAASRTITIVNAGVASASVAVDAASFALDLRGKPAIVRRRDPAARWLRLQPSRVAVRPGGAALVTVSPRIPAGALPGDHPVLVLLRTQPHRAEGVAIRIRIGVVVYVRVPGRVVHRLTLGSLRVRHRVLEAIIVNRGNVVERTRVRVVLLRNGRVLRRLGSAERTVLPHARAVARLRLRGDLRGRFTARLRLGTLERTLRLRL